MPNGVTHLEMLQREYTAEYNRRLELFRNAQILFAVLTTEGYIILTNPFFGEALGYDDSRLHYSSVFGKLAEADQPKVIRFFGQMDYREVVEEVLTFVASNGQHFRFLCWFSRWATRSSGARVATIIGALLKE